jgi:hypothetical protein
MIRRSPNHQYSWQASLVPAAPGTGDEWVIEWNLKRNQRRKVSKTCVCKHNFVYS